MLLRVELAEAAIMGDFVEKRVDIQLYGAVYVGVVRRSDRQVPSLGDGRESGAEMALTLKSSALP